MSAPKLWKDGERVCVAINCDGDPVWLPKRVKADPADLLAVVRRGVESGTINPQELLKALPGVSWIDSHADARYVPGRVIPVSTVGQHAVIPVSDGGSET